MNKMKALRDCKATLYVSLLDKKFCWGIDISSLKLIDESDNLIEEIFSKYYKTESGCKKNWEMFAELNDITERNLIRKEL